MLQVPLHWSVALPHTQGRFSGRTGPGPILQHHLLPAAVKSETSCLAFIPHPRDKCNPSPTMRHTQGTKVLRTKRFIKDAECFCQVSEQVSQQGPGPTGPAPSLISISSFAAGGGNLSKAPRDALCPHAHGQDENLSHRRWGLGRAETW